MDAATGQATGLADQEQRVWTLWRSLKRLFPVWSLASSSFHTPGSLQTIGGNDFVSGLRRNRNSHQTFAVLDGASGEEFDALSALANINLRRQTRLLRAIVIMYITVPLSLVATAGEIAPDMVTAWLRENQRFAWTLFFGSTVAALWYIAGWWRACQMVDVIDLFRLARGRQPYTALELREE